MTAVDNTRMRIVLGILGVALVATLTDYTWYTLHVRHSVIAGDQQSTIKNQQSAISNTFSIQDSAFERSRSPVANTNGMDSMRRATTLELRDNRTSAR